MINIGPDDEFISINQLALLISEILNFNLDPIYVPGRPKEVELANCSADKAKKILGYNPKTKLRNGLEELANWIIEVGPKDFNYHLPIEIVNDLTPKTWTNKLI